jgi:hypothetical protein
MSGELDTLLLMAARTDAGEFLSGESDLITGRVYVCPSHGRLDAAGVLQPEPRRYLYACAECGAPVAQEVPF